jgi:hypothetical protein
VTVESAGAGRRLVELGELVGEHRRTLVGSPDRRCAAPLLTVATIAHPGQRGRHACNGCILLADKPTSPGSPQLAVDIVILLDDRLSLFHLVDLPLDVVMGSAYARHRGKPTRNVNADNRPPAGGYGGLWPVARLLHQAAAGPRDKPTSGRRCPTLRCRC